MKVAVSAPIPLLREYCNAIDYHLCNPLLILKSKIYRDFYLEKRTRGDFVMMDSSSSEPRQSIPSDQLIRAAYLLKPHLLVAPDWDMNSTKTVQLVLDFLRDYGGQLRSSGIGILGMVQGASLSQCLFCYKNIIRLVDAIGLPRSIEKGTPRAEFIKKIKTSKSIHIFGVHSNPEDELDNLLDLERSNVVGIVSDLPIRLGFLCRLLDEFRPEPPKLDPHSNRNPFPEFTKKNIEEFILLAGGEI